ncbi:Alpha-1,2-fucosyltransferase [Rhodopirellula islandica]|uniref:Alpha-1,2-fucosyltransferase n=1 Tax=Rhodopirellula islandica TaxID=595434 RepID=A0A0J1E8G0_RHOIS|nr:alpha-1,2-fucosyltransferase [Rhodopirellula islandica]KLU01744.1 Alpha-1,2-fucosyltransferase [Rhodopirellula islandica]
MIVTRLIGGLGNQLFQYAFGHSLARRTYQTLLIDDSAFEEYRLHPLAINHFSISASRLSDVDRSRVPGKFRRTPVGRAWDQFGRRMVPGYVGALPVRREKPFGFRESLITPERDLYLDGYWQSEKFFPGLRESLREELRLRETPSETTQRLSEQMNTENSVAIHVRRGDYVTSTKAKQIYRTLDADYYRSCLLDLAARETDLKLYLFSNDVPWCESNLDVGIPFTPVQHTDGQTAHEDLHLIAQCRHVVIANSTFSWWGAYLGQSHASRRVYFPEPWFHPGTLDGSAMGCDDWISEASLAERSSREISRRAA